MIYLTDLTLTDDLYFVELSEINVDSVLLDALAGVVASLDKGKRPLAKGAMMLG